MYLYMFVFHFDSSIIFLFFFCDWILWSDSGRAEAGGSQWKRPSGGRIFDSVSRIPVAINSLSGKTIPIGSIGFIMNESQETKTKKTHFFF